MRFVVASISAFASSPLAMERTWERLGQYDYRDKANEEVNALYGSLVTDATEQEER